MDKALYTAMTGASASLRSTAAVAHNLANVSTVGFKAELVGTEVFQVPSKTALPTRFDAVPRNQGFDASQGTLQVTGNELDIALHEGVWLAIQDRNGEEAYTRAGELRVNPNGLLTTVDGKTVLGPNGPVSLPPRQNVLIAADGGLSIVPQGSGPETLAQVGQLKLVKPPPGGLERGEDGLFRRRGQDPFPPTTGVALTSGALESSNVQATSALVQLIELQRMYETQVKVIKSAEENARSSTSLMRLG